MFNYVRMTQVRAKIEQLPLLGVNPIAVTHEFLKSC